MQNELELAKQGIKENTKTATKIVEGKSRYDLISPFALEQLAKVYTHGANKYADRNMDLGTNWGKYFGAMMRHAWAFWRGEDYDKDNGLPHLAAVAWNAFTLLDYMENHRDKDDRPKQKLKKSDGMIALDQIINEIRKENK